MTFITPGFAPESTDQKNIAFYIDELEQCMRESDFQRDFFEDLCDQFDKKKTLSYAQIASLRKMYERICL